MADIRHPDCEFRAQGFPKKTLFISILKNIPDLLSDGKECKIIENIDFEYFSNRASFMGNSVHHRLITIAYGSIYINKVIRSMQADQDILSQVSMFRNNLQMFLSEQLDFAP